MPPKPIFDKSPQGIGARIDSFVSKNPKRPVDLWKASSMKLIHKTIADMLAFKAGETLYDAGCGVGHFLETLIPDREPSHVTGVDLSPVSIEVAKNTYPQHVWVTSSMNDFAAAHKYTGAPRLDAGVAIGTLCYNIGIPHWDYLQQGMLDIAAVSKRNVAYLLYTDKPDWKPVHNATFIRFNPDEVMKRLSGIVPFVQCEVRQECLVEFDKSYADLDVYFLKWGDVAF